jgi:hypothetical protein
MEKAGIPEMLPNYAIVPAVDPKTAYGKSLAAMAIALYKKDVANQEVNHIIVSGERTNVDGLAALIMQEGGLHWLEITKESYSNSMKSRLDLFTNTHPINKVGTVHYIAREEDASEFDKRAKDQLKGYTYEFHAVQFDKDPAPKEKKKLKDRITDKIDDIIGKILNP